MPHGEPSGSVREGRRRVFQMANRQAKRRFYQIATKAIEMGLLTPADRDTIRRHATRKRGNWVRHLRNLCDYLNDKQARENEEHA